MSIEPHQVSGAIGKRRGRRGKLGGPAAIRGGGIFRRNIRRYELLDESALSEIESLADWILKGPVAKLVIPFKN